MRRHPVLSCLGVVGYLAVILFATAALAVIVRGGAPSALLEIARSDG